VLGIRAFGTQLLCEQVIGRALRRQSYDLNEDGPDKGLFNVEYADVLGTAFGLVEKVGATGRSTYYRLRKKPDTNPTNPT
jgi:hypothetical protein